MDCGLAQFGGQGALVEVVHRAEDVIVVLQAGGLGGGDDPEALAATELGDEVVGQVVVQGGEGSRAADPQHRRDDVRRIVEELVQPAEVGLQGGEGLDIAVRIVGGDVGVVAGRARGHQAQEVGEAGLLAMPGLVGLEPGVAVALALVFDHAIADGRAQIAWGPFRQRRPVGHLAAEDHRPVAGVIVAQELLARQSGLPLDRGRGEAFVLLDGLQ